MTTFYYVLIRSKKYSYMKRNLFLLLVFTLNIQILFAVIAYPKAVIVQTAFGSISLRMEGDESLKYAITETGHTVMSDGSTWYYLLKDDKGNIINSEIEVRPQTLLHNSMLNVLRSNPTKDEILSSRAKSLISDTRAVNETSTRAQKAVIGKRKVLIVLMQFPDNQFAFSRQDFDELFNAKNYSYDGAAGSVRDYYAFASNGQLDLTSDIVGPYTSKNKMSYYGGNSFFGGNDKNPYELFKEALEQVGKDVNLSEYDSNGDGYVDNLHIIYAGYGEEAGAESSAIWAHEMSFTPIDIQDVKIDRYSCAPELRSNSGYGISRIGPHCHEIGHALGAMDYYDTDYETGGQYSGTSTWDVMASGSWNDDGIRPANFNAYTKCYEFGWCNIEEITEGEDLLLKPSATDNLIYQVNTPIDGEFFLLENRQQTSFDSSCPGHGMLIYHISKDIESHRNKNDINSTYPQNCYIVCASSEFAIPTKDSKSYGVINSDGCPFPGSKDKHTFGRSSKPAAVCINGAYAGFNVTAIAESSAGNILFNINSEEVEDPGEDTPKDWDTLLQDNVTTSSLNEIWQSVPTNGNTNWTVESSKDNYYLKLNCSFFSGGGLSCSARLTSNPLEIKHSGKLQISLKAASAKFSSLRKDNLTISIIDSNTNTVTYSKQIPVNNFNWQEYISEVNIDAGSIIIQIDGLCNIGSELMIDDICVKLSSPNTANPKVRNSEQIKDQFYDIHGNVINRQPSKGLYIIGNKKIYSL